MENSKNKYNRLLIIFLYPCQGVIKHYFVLLLLPWLMSFLGCPTHIANPQPSAPPIPGSEEDEPPSYEEANLAYEDDDLKSEISAEKTIRKIAKTKEEAKKYAKNALDAAEKGIKNCRQLLREVIPRLEKKSLCLSQAVPHLDTYYNLTEKRSFPFNTPFNNTKKAIDVFREKRDAYSVKLANEKTNFTFHLQSAKGELGYAERCINKAKSLGSKKEHNELETRRKQLEKQLEDITKESAEIMEHKTTKEQMISEMTEKYKNFIQYSASWGLPSGLNNRNENQIIIQNQ